MIRNEIFRAFRIPLVLILTFEVYFGLIAYVIYDFFQVGPMSMLLLPRIFFSSFVAFFFIAFILGIIQRWIRVNNVLVILVFPVSIVYLLQFFSLYYSGNFMIGEALSEYHAVWIYLNVRNISIIAGFMSFVLSLFLALKRKTDFRIGWKLLIVQQMVTLIFFVFFFLAYYGYQKLSENYASSFPSPKKTPLVAFVQALSQPSVDKRPRFSDAELDLLEKEYGIVVNNDEFPYEKSKIFSHKIPFTPKEIVSKPNVIIFFVESFSARFLTPYGSVFSGITPNIDTFSMSSMVVKGYYNHTIPTLNGLVGQLCSMYPHFRNEDFEDKRQNVRVNSLISILNQQGYRSSVFCYENKGFSLYPVMRSLGFENLKFKQDIEKERGFNAERNDYLSDKELMDYYTSELKKQRNDSQPFVHVISTVSTHIGFETKSTYSKYNNYYLNTVYEFDSLFGVFWQTMQKSGLAKNTIVILTADHCLPYSIENKGLYVPTQPSCPMFDYVPLIIYCQTYNLPHEYKCHSSSIAFTPTILHLLGINNIRNSFLGGSIFETDTSKTVLGIYSSYLYGVKKDGICRSLVEDSLLSKWKVFNTFVIENNKLVKP